MKPIKLPPSPIPKCTYKQLLQIMEPFNATDYLDRAWDTFLVPYDHLLWCIDLFNETLVTEPKFQYSVKWNSSEEAFEVILSTH